MAVELIAHTDGACSGNPGPGGWGAVIQAHQNGQVIKTREIHGGEPETTNNRMELRAAIEVLAALERPSAITIVTDSSYVKDGIQSWIQNWKRNGWKTAAKKPVKNVDLWQELDALTQTHDVTWQWIKGHAGHELNERADALAREGAREAKG